MFSHIAECALVEARTEFRWDRQPRVFERLDHEEVQYMDDGVLWAPTVQLLQRVENLQQVLLRYGLTLNLSKCQLYSSPACTGSTSMTLDGVVLNNVGHLDVMGLRMRGWDDGL